MKSGIPEKCSDNLEICPTANFPGGRIFYAFMDRPVSCSLSLGRSHYVALANTGKEVFSPSNFITIGGTDVTFVPMTEIYHYRSPQEG